MSIMTLSEKIALYNQDQELHGREATLLENGTVEIRLWRNKSCSPTVKVVSMSTFMYGRLPSWECNQHGGWYIANL